MNSKKKDSSVCLDDYSYNLPDILIAQKPSKLKDACRLMIVDPDQKIVHKRFKDIINYIKSGDVLVLNDTKVTHSKLLGKKESGSPAEIIILKRVNAQKLNNNYITYYTNSFEAKIKTRNPHVGTKILLEDGTATIVSQKDIDTYIVELDNNKILKNAILPTPPYITRKLFDSEYQTTFAKNNGSLAAPTAGLHFTRKLLNAISKKGIKIVYITLHVSYGTFKKIDDITNYVMDPEQYTISDDAAKIINNRKGKLIVCGTTTLKALETATDYKTRKIKSGTSWSTLFIYPPYKFKSGTDILITNFHLPKSTLLLLTCAFGGKDRILNAYHVAVKKKYRFYSLGDAMMISNEI